MPTKYKRLRQYIHDYFPEPKYSTSEIETWANESVPAWKHISKTEQKDILQDWEEYITPMIEEEIEGKSPTIWRRLRRFLGRLLGRG